MSYRNVLLLGAALGALTLVYAPIALLLISQLQQPVFGVVTLAATGANEISAPTAPLLVVVFGNGETRSTAAGNQKHLELSGRLHW
jgi:hypothetical protein